MTRHTLPRRTATTTRFSPEGIGCQKKTAPRFCQHPIRWAFTSQAFTRWRHLSTHPIKHACYSFIDPGRMTGWVGSWLTCSGRFTHIVVTRQLQAKRRTGSVRRPKTGVPPTMLRVPTAAAAFSDQQSTGCASSHVTSLRSASLLLAPCVQQSTVLLTYRTSSASATDNSNGNWKHFCIQLNLSQRIVRQWLLHICALEILLFTCLPTYLLVYAVQRNK